LVLSWETSEKGSSAVENRKKGNRLNEAPGTTFLFPPRTLHIQKPFHGEERSEDEEDDVGKGQTQKSGKKDQQKRGEKHEGDECKS